MRSWLLVVVVVACKQRAPASHETAATSAPAAPSSIASASPSATASASSASQAPATPTTYASPDAGATWETMDRWAKARLAKAKSKELELVRIPIHKHGVGWGCTCPDHYIGSMEVAGTSTIWLEPTFEPTAVPVPATETRVAEGYFTGNTSPFRGDEATVYTLLGFRVLRTRIATPSELDMDGDGEHARVIASGAEAGLEQRPPTDGRPILLLESSFPLGPGAATAASKRADSLRAKYPNVSVIDSRTTPGLFCCNDVVVLDRFATEREATAEAKRAKSLGVAATVRRGW